MIHRNRLQATAVARESPLPLGLLFLDAHDYSRMFLPVQEYAADAMAIGVNGEILCNIPSDMVRITFCESSRPLLVSPVDDTAEQKWPHASKFPHVGKI